MVSNVGRHPVRAKDPSLKVKKMKMKLTAIPRQILNDLQYNLIDVKLLQRNVLDKSDFILLTSYQTNEEKIEILLELMRNKNENHHNNFLEIMEEDYPWLRDKCEIFLQKIRLEALPSGNSGTATTVIPSEEPNIKQESATTEESDRCSPSEGKSSSSPDSTAIPPRHEKTKICVVNSEKNAAPARDDKKFSQIITPEMMTIVRRNHRVVRKWTTLAHTMGMSSCAHTLRMRMILNGEDPDVCVLHLLEEWKGSHPKEASLGKLIAILREEDFNDVADDLEEKFA